MSSALSGAVFTGLGLMGTVLEVRGEQMKVALDIDGRVSTGDYFYNWYPVTEMSSMQCRRLGQGCFEFYQNCYKCFKTKDTIPFWVYTVFV